MSTVSVPAYATTLSRGPAERRFVVRFARKAVRPGGERAERQDGLRTVVVRIREGESITDVMDWHFGADWSDLETLAEIPAIED